MSNLTKSLTIGATVAAIFVMMYAMAAINEDIIQTVISFAVMLPLALYARNFGLKASLLATSAALLLSSFMVTPVVFVTYSIPTAIIGTSLGYSMRKLKKAAPVVATVSLLMMLQIVYELLITYFIFKIDVFQEYKDIVAKILDAANDYKLLGFFGSAGKNILSDIILYAVPAILILGACAKAIVVYVLAAIVSMRIFKQQTDMTVPQLKVSERPLAIAFLASFAICFAPIFLAINEKIPYCFVFSILFDLELLITYIYLVHWFMIYSSYFNVKRNRNFVASLLSVALFPLTACLFAALCLFRKRN